MATKAEERKALDEIKRIVAGLGNDSYIGMAFEGCFEMAESNIDNDFANSPKEAINTLKEKLENATAKAADNEAAYGTLSKRFAAMKEANIEQMKKQNESIEALKIERDDAQRSAIATEARVNDLEAQLKAREMEIIVLKAKLYDMITA